MDIRMKIEFEFTSEFGVFRDAIVLPDNHGMSEAQITDIKQQRFDAWLEAIQPAEEEEIIEDQEVKGEE
jgi:hypothetical protein